MPACRVFAMYTYIARKVKIAPCNRGWQGGRAHDTTGGALNRWRLSRSAPRQEGNVTTIHAKRFRALACLLVLLLTAPLPAGGQQAPPAAPAGEAAPAFTAEQLEQIAAPVALYPDPLLAQV